MSPATIAMLLAATALVLVVAFVFLKPRKKQPTPLGDAASPKANEVQASPVPAPEPSQANDGDIAESDEESADPVTRLQRQFTKEQLATMLAAEKERSTKRRSWHPAPEAKGHLVLQAAGASGSGKRPHNEDDFLSRPEKGLFAVADGTGEEGSGKLAAEIACETVYETFMRGIEAPAGQSLSLSFREVLFRAIKRANEQIHDVGKKRTGERDFAATLVAVFVMNERQSVLIGHVGNSRCYRLRRDDLRLLTTDHTLESYGITGPAGTTLTRALGGDAEVRVEWTDADIGHGDVFLLCSDGLNRSLPENAIQNILVGEKEPLLAARNLVDAATKAGAKDNVTALVIRASDSGI